jgi:hypothetical protein
MTTKKKYHVNVHERWLKIFEVEAESVEQAIELANNKLEDGSDDILFEYIDTQDIDTWGVYEIKEDN